MTAPMDTSIPFRRFGFRGRLNPMGQAGLRTPGHDPPAECSGQAFDGVRGDEVLDPG
jgi:hypothetical protein